MPGIGQASAEGSRPLPTDGVHGCFVGNGLDRSGDVCRCCMVKYCCGVGATIGRPPTYRSNVFSGIVSCKANGRGRAMLAPTRVFRQPGGRIYAARQCTANGRLWETRGPGMPGPYRAAVKKRTPTQPSRPSILAAGLPLTPSPQTPLLPPSRRFPPFPPYRRC